MHRLIYHSRFSPAFPALIEDQDHEVRQIIQASIRNNRLANVTGMLLLRETEFLQVLEGPGEAVKATYDRIAADPRHRRARVLNFAKVEAREFADWNMCAHRLSKADDAILATLNEGAKPGFDHLSHTHALRLLKRIREVQASTLARGMA